MCCENTRQQLGRFLDDELAPDVRAEVSDHVQTCAACSLELERLRDLTSALFDRETVSVPGNLWDSIERRLDSQSDPAAVPHQARRWKFRRRPWVLAASVVLAVGLGLLGPRLVDTQARASTVNFGVLLDALPLDAQKAFRKFLAFYDAQEASPVDAERFAPSLDFATPPTLPGGFRLKSVYLLQFGDEPGIAASYERNGEFLATIFHAPVEQEDFGTHKDYPCVVGKHHGHKVEVGEWSLVHLTSPTTCHCVLSRLDEGTELPAVMAAVAPHTSASDPHGHDD